MVHLNTTPCASECSETADYLGMEPADVTSASPLKDQTRDGDDVISDVSECDVKPQTVEGDESGLEAADHDPMAGDVPMETPMPDRPKPPDGGWGWMCVLGHSINAVVVTLLTRAFGVTYLQLLKHYDCSPAAVAWVGALSITCNGIFGPVATTLVTRFSCRAVTIAGSLVCFLGVCLTALAPNIYVCFATYGIITGFGTSLVTTPGFFMIDEYFEKWKATAMGLSSVGYGVAMLMAPPLMLHLFTHYGHQWGLLIIAALCLHGCIGGALFRPLEENNNIKVHTKSCNDDKKIRHHKNVSFNVRLFLNVHFLSFMILMLALMFCTSVLSGLLPALAVENNISLDNATLILALMGIGDIFGSTLLGRILDFECVRGKRFYWISGCNIIVAISVGVNPFFYTTTAFIILAIARSMFIGHVMSQRLTLLGGIVPRNQVHGAMGIMLFCQAVGSLGGRGIGGVLKSALGSYSYAFYLTGVLQVIASISTCLTYGISKHRAQRRASMVSIGRAGLNNPNVLI